MKTIRSDIIKALQFVDRRHPMRAEADATAKAVAWLTKNKDQLLQIIHNLATPENEAVPAATKTLMGVIHAHAPLRPLEPRVTPASRIALMLLEKPCSASVHLSFAPCAAHLRPQRPTRAGANE
jgi:hypothetical protein